MQNNFVENMPAQPPDAQSSSSPAPFQPSSAAIRVNVLWFASLLFSLIAASFGILVKQWLREYMVVQNPSPRARLRLRYVRFPALSTWKVFEIAAALPLLLQLSLSLFFVGLCYFTASVHPSIGYTTLPLVIGWALCFVITAALPLLSPRCPYRTTLLQTGISRLHRALCRLHDRTSRYLSENATQLSFHRAIDFELPPHLFWKGLHIILSRLTKAISASDEEKAVQCADEDLNILAAADAVQSNDELLSTTIVEAVNQIEKASYSDEQLLSFLQGILVNRLVYPVSQGLDTQNTCNLAIDLRTTSLSSRSRDAILTIVRNHLQSRDYVETAANTESQQESCAEAQLSLPVFTLAMLFSMSGRSLQDFPALTPVLWRQSSVRLLLQYCHSLFNLSPTVDQRLHGPSFIRRSILEGVSQLCHWRGSVNADWHSESLAPPFLHSLLDPGKTDPRNDFQVKRTHPYDSGAIGWELIQDDLTICGLRIGAMVDLWPTREGYKDIIEVICEDLQRSLENCPSKDCRMDNCPSDHSTKDSFPLGHSRYIHLPIVELISLFLCLQCRWHEHAYWARFLPILYPSSNPRHMGRGYGNALPLIICRCVPTPDILRLCVRTAEQHGHELDEDPEQGK